MPRCLSRRPQAHPSFEPVHCSGGAGYTGAEFNGDLKSLLKGQVDYSKGKISIYSFRAGLATEMAKLGYADQDIMNIGRWRSAA